MATKQNPSDPEDPLARLSQEATNQSSPDKSLGEQKAGRTPKRKTAQNRTKPPKN